MQYMISTVLLFAEPRVGKVWSKRLEGDSRSHRNCRHIYSLLTDAAVITADVLSSLLPWLTQQTQLWRSSNRPCFLGRAHTGIQHKAAVTKRVPCDTHSQGYRDLCCYIIIIYKTGARVRGHGTREPDHAILANLLFPYARVLWWWH